MMISKTKFVYQCQGCGCEIDEEDWNEEDDYYHGCTSHFLLTSYTDNEDKTPDYEYDSYDYDEF